MSKFVKFTIILVTVALVSMVTSDVRNLNSNGCEFTPFITYCVCDAIAYHVVILCLYCLIRIIC